MRGAVASELVAGKVWALPKPQRPVATAAVLARVHVSRVRDHDHSHQARTHRDRGPREQLRYPPTRKPVSEDAALRHLALDGKVGPAGWNRGSGRAAVPPTRSVNFYNSPKR